MKYILATLCVVLMGIATGCSKTSALAKKYAVAAYGPEFREITGRKKEIPTLSIDGAIKESNPRKERKGFKT
jgi:hypothetical protein